MYTKEDVRTLILGMAKQAPELDWQTLLVLLVDLLETDQSLTKETRAVLTGIAASAYNNAQQKCLSSLPEWSMAKN